MAKFRKLPVVIEAEQFFPERHPWPQGVVTDQDGMSASGEFHIETLEGRHLVRPGDFIITGVKGERYACKPDIFQESYEPVED